METLPRLPVGYLVRLRAVGESAPPEEETNVADIRKNLDQLDRQLDELKEHVGGLGEGPDQPPPLGAPPARRSPPPPIPELPPNPPAAPAAAAASPAGASGAASRADWSALQSDLESIAHLRLQIEQLQAVRDRLLGDARELIQAYEHQLDAIEQGQGAAAATRPPATESIGSRGVQPRPAFFEGKVTLIVSGAHRIQTIEVLEDALFRVSHVEDVYIRRCHRGELWLELALSGGTELLGELNRVLPFPFALHSATGQEVALSLEGEAAA